ncbi:MAG: phospholipase A [Chitinophagaceae bacterium]|nr:phospholipase A [Oligoflexus sp.]
MKVFALWLLSVFSVLCLTSRALALELPTNTTPSLSVSPELERVKEEDDDNIFKHRDIYFLSGKPDTKVQFSLKLRPLKTENLFLGYTQQMFWRLGADSSPFSDINYNPELYYEWVIDEHFVRFMRLGIEHRSNGKDGPTSRSVDRVYADTEMGFGMGKYEVNWNLKLYRVYDVDWVNNRDIINYMGWWSTQFKIQGVDSLYFPRKAEASLAFYPGGGNSQKIGNGALEMSIKYRARLFGFMPYLMVQYYYGYMESLVIYNHKTHSYRIGFNF